MGKSKKKGKAPQRGRTSPKALLRLGAVLLTIGILMGGAVLFLTPEQAAYVPEVIGGPRVAIAQEKIDFGDVKLNTTVEAVFRVRNIGDEVLQFLDYEPLVELKDGC
jgi:hypothetical protein